VIYELFPDFDVAAAFYTTGGKILKDSNRYFGWNSNRDSNRYSIPTAVVPTAILV
jgi:hypothetical protein